MNGGPARAFASVHLPVATRRLRLERPSAARDRELVRLLLDPSVSAWTTIPFPYTPASARAFRRQAEVGWRTGTDLPLQIVRSEDGALVGGIGLHAVSVPRSRAELGYWVGRPFRGEGIAREAVDALMRVAFGPLRLHRLEAHVFPGNRASIAVLRGAGFHREGRLRKSFPHGAAWRDELLYGRLAGRTGRSASPGRTK